MPCDKVDIIISEWMGYFLLFEGMLDSVFFARDKWLKDDGIMAPSSTEILIAAVDDSEWYNDTVNFWKDVYGFKMNVMSDIAIRQAQISILPAKSLSSDPVTIKQINTKNDTTLSLDFKSTFSLEIKRTGTVYAICGYFDTFFDGDSKISFSTSPTTLPTHWMQTLFILETPVKVDEGAKLEGVFICKKSTSNPRELDVTIEYHVGNGDKKIQYFQVV